MKAIKDMLELLCFGMGFAIILGIWIGTCAWCTVFIYKLILPGL